MDQKTTSTNTQNKDEQKDSIDLIDMKVLSESLNYLNTSLNTATSKGSYNLDDAFKVKLSFNNVVKACETLEKCQNLIIKSQQDQQNLPNTGQLDTNGLDSGLVTKPHVKEVEV